MSNPIVSDEDIEFKMIEFYIKYYEFKRNEIKTEQELSDYNNLIITNMNELVIPYLKIIFERLESIFNLILVLSASENFKKYMEPLDFFETIFCENLYNILFNTLQKHQIFTSNDEKMIHYIFIRIECFKYQKYVQLINCDKLLYFQYKPSKYINRTSIKNYGAKPNYVFICFINNKIMQLKKRITMIYDNLLKFFPEFTESIKLIDLILHFVFVSQ